MFYVSVNCLCHVTSWQHWLELSRFLQCFDVVGLVIWPVKIVFKMTYYVLSGTLSLYTTTTATTGIESRGTWQNHMSHAAVMINKCRTVTWPIRCHDVWWTLKLHAPRLRWPRPCVDISVLCHVPRIIFTLNISGVDEGQCRSPNIFAGNAIPTNDIRTRGNGDTVVFHQIGFLGLILLKLRGIC